MKVYFYEEFPTKENLEKIKLIKFTTKLIIAAKSIEEFRKTKINNKNVKEIIYWPVLTKNEGYWLSAFTRHSALKRIINDLQQYNKEIMWDAELPLLKKSLFLTQLPFYFKNRKLIKNCFKTSKAEIITSEYPLESGLLRKMFSSIFMISFDSNKYNNKKISMLYTSFFKKHPSIETHLDRQVSLGKKLFGKNFMVGLGAIAKGILGNEPILTPQELNRDLRIVKNNKINEVVIYRLGGLNKEYVDVINGYV
jgi:hypothetical protein